MNTLCHNWRCSGLVGLVIAALVASASGQNHAYENEGRYLSALADLGYDLIIEDFEGPDWDPYRTVNPFDPQSAPQVASQGITWSGNEEVTTNRNWGRRNSWGIFTIYVQPGSPDELYGDCEQTLYGVGGWFNSNPDFGADIAIEIDGEIVADRKIGTGHEFLGVIVPGGFTSFRILDLEREAVWGADDFTFGVVGRLPGDYDGDRDVDLDDYDYWPACETGPDAGPPPDGCDAFDADNDRDVDLDDFARVMTAFTGW